MDMNRRNFLSGAAALTLAGRAAPVPSPQSTARSLRGDPGFNDTQLSPNARLWYARMWSALRSPNPTPDLTKQGATGDLWFLGRSFNQGVTALLNVLRVTGDLRLLDEVDRSMELARAQIKDYDGDGFRNWRYLEKSHNPALTGHDRGSSMWDMEAHALAACVAYAYRINEDLKSPAGIPYKERAAFWQSYLKNDFEGKWRSRNNKPTGFPFLERTLVHPYAQFIRYHHYLGKLSGDNAYSDYALVMAARLAQYRREAATPKGPAYIWLHQTLEESKTIQPIGYGNFTLGAVQDLCLDGFEPYASNAEIEKYARTVSQFLLIDGANSFATDVAGEKDRAGYLSQPRVGPKGLPGVRWKPQTYAGSQLSFFAAWDPSGKIEKVAADVYNRVSADGSGRYVIPAAMVFVQLYAGPQARSRS